MKKIEAIKLVKEVAEHQISAETCEKILDTLYDADLLEPFYQKKINNKTLDISGWEPEDD